MRIDLQVSRSMPFDHEHREARHEAILAILESERVTSQAELVDRLGARGISATQSSISRDLRDLGVAWIGGRYSLPGVRGDRDPAFAEVAVFLRGWRCAGPNLTVVTTAIGMAQSVALALDRTGWPEVVGTVAGDDTFFVATAGAREQNSLLRRLESFRKEA
jgi:transcriptional regulator of arginine metabolism